MIDKASAGGCGGSSSERVLEEMMHRGPYMFHRPQLSEGRDATLPSKKLVINKRGAAPQHPFQWLCPLVRYSRFLNHFKGVPFYQLFSIHFSDWGVYCHLK